MTGRKRHGTIVHEFTNEPHSLAKVKRLPYRQAASQHKDSKTTSCKNQVCLAMVHANPHLDFFLWFRLRVYRMPTWLLHCPVWT